MITRIKTDNDVVVFELEGYLDFETTLQLKETTSRLMAEKSPCQIVFNLKHLKFVGSSGISQFVLVLKVLNRNKKAKPKMCHVSSEFHKIFRSYQTTRHPFDIYESEGEAIAAFAPPPAQPPVVESPTVV